MPQDGTNYWIVPTLGATTFPVEDILTGRGVIFGKSGSGKSNSTGVIVEQLIESGYTLMIVDQEGEYLGLKESYDVLHVGNGDDCDLDPTLSDIPDIIDVTLQENTPVLLDVSDYLDTEFARELVAETLSALFHAQKNVQKPNLVVLEEVHEFLPQTGGGDEVSKQIERIAKRGRKRGIGTLGISQRPSSVDKDFVTQCDWHVWHRLTWKNDVNVVRDILGSTYASRIEDLETGEAFLLMDWEEDIERVTFKRKKTEDIGATPGLENYERINAGHNSGSEPQPDPLEPAVQPEIDTGDEAGQAEAGQDETGEGDTGETEGAHTGQHETAAGESATIGTGGDTAAGNVADGAGTGGVATGGERTTGDETGNGDKAGDATEEVGTGGDATAADTVEEDETGNGDTAADTVGGDRTEGDATVDDDTEGDRGGEDDTEDQTHTDDSPDTTPSSDSFAGVRDEDLSLSYPVTENDLVAASPEALVSDLNTLRTHHDELADQLDDVIAQLRSASSLEEVSIDGVDGEDTEEDTRKPEPPTPPEPRSGIAGNLVEFAQLTTYMAKLFAYRLRLVTSRR